MGNAVEVKNLCKTYPGFQLNNISFEVPTGYVCGFVGPNGAGKTTTLRTMLGMSRKTSGEIKLLGVSADDVSVKESIGVLFDQPYFQEDWNALDIEKSLEPFYSQWDSAVYHGYLKRFELDEKKKFKNFSRGMKMKLGMAVILSYRAKLLLLDEPTRGLDSVARDEMLDILREYIQGGERSILFSTHITSDLEKIADTIVYISKGSITFSGETEEMKANYCVVRGGTKLPGEKRTQAIGIREHQAGYECLMELKDIGGLPKDAIVEQATIDDIIVYTERNMKYGSND